MNRISNLQSILPDNIDCAIITSNINRRYFTNFKSSDGVLLIFRLHPPILLVDSRYIEMANNTVAGIKILEQIKLFSQLTELFAQFNVKNTAVESQIMTLSEYNKFKNSLPGVNIDTSEALSQLIGNLRGIKDESEITAIKKAQEIAENGFTHILKFIQIGKTEKEIAFELDCYMLKNGAESISFDTIVLSGRNTSLPHGVPTDKKISSGEFILFDFGAVYNGYHSDMSRTICVGKPTKKMAEIYNIVLLAQSAGLAAAKKGISGAELDAISRDIITNMGYGGNFRHGLGHGVGLEIHEFPTVSVRAKIPLEENNVITIEPGIYLEGEFGVRIEDFIRITDLGCENITKVSKNLICL